MSRASALWVLVLAATVSGCAGLRLPESLSRPPWSKTPDDATPPTPTAARASAHRTRAEDLERQGALREALAAWNSALGLEPTHAPTEQAIKRVRARIDREVGEHLQRGRLAAAEARRQFVAALALDPASRVALEALRTAPGCPGCRDEVHGVATATLPAARTEPNAVAARPGGDDEKPDVLYNVAMGHLAEGRDDDAYRVLVQLARVTPPYKDSATLLRNVRTRLVRQHYQEGLRLFREEKIEQAIAEWRVVLEIDPKQANARRNIEQAERMLHTLAEEQKR